MTVLHDPREFFDVDAIQDPYPLYDRLRSDGPVHQVGDSGFYVVCDWAAINDAINRPEEFSSNLTATMMFTAEGTVVPFELDGLGGPTQILATADDPSHAAHRKMLVPQLAAKRIRVMETSIAETFEQLWADGLRDRRIEWMGALANRLPMMVVAKLIGVPAQDVDQLIRWAYLSTQLLDGLVDEERLTASGVAAMKLGNYIHDQFTRSAADPQDNLLGALATACSAGEFDGLTAQLMMIILFSAGGESTASLLGNSMEILATRPDIQQQLRENPDLLGPFVEETLRYEPPFRGHYRHVVADTTLGGTDLPAGSRLLLLWGAANRDPAHFDAPNEFRLDRSTGKGHITFGKGLHFCVGAALARLEAEILLRAVLAGCSWIDAVDVGPWLPSLLVRRREHLWLRVRGESVVEA
ncbi:cytochrome P450 [Mycobacterium sp. JS623]|uniref:cytochrome P450 n=1 Tax=Mycobacterium sp. JS623 TaxID=212767 RepID=UPI0002A581E9|nr:cytochrome P450 [Mycobacterium sp. JS623]AGB22098.1 cytochrome P450 [Mycobacterium sp. JS623]